MEIGSLYPGKAMRMVEWSANVFSCIRGRQCGRWSVVVTWFLEFSDDIPLGGVAWKTVSLYPRKSMRSVEWRVNVFPFITEGNAIGGVVWKRISLYQRKAMRSVVWLGNVLPCIRGGQCARCCSVETWFLFYAEGNKIV